MKSLFNKLKWSYLLLLPLLFSSCLSDDDTTSMVKIDNESKIYFDFKPGVFDRQAGGDEFFNMSIPYPTKADFQLESYEINEELDTIAATYRVKNLLNQYFVGYQEGQVIDGGDLLITLDNSDVANKKVYISEANEFNGENPYEDSHYWTSWSFPEEDHNFQNDFFFKLTPERASYSYFDFAETPEGKGLGILNLQFDYQHWRKDISAATDELIFEGAVLLELDFNF
ncbi:hypothetical protein [Aureivirga sp. CE67]|uniref:hypothetical protein n=1 Tax=Aureivirga sp. CE67 TaxID=1788983 RepID=UPI0018CAF42D|nr:hypothetical protein [Aureivirga sp. CE67]